MLATSIIPHIFNGWFASLGATPGLRTAMPKRKGYTVLEEIPGIDPRDCSTDVTVHECQDGTCFVRVQVVAFGSFPNVEVAKAAMALVAAQHDEAL